MGSMAACYLQAAGFRVEALVQDASASALKRELTFPSGESVSLSLAVTSPQASSPDITHVLLATKAGQTRAALAPWLSRLADDVTLVCLQNGMGQLDGIDLPPQVRLLPTITTNGAFRQGEQVRVVAENSTFIGDDDAAPDWFMCLQTHWPGLAWCADLRQRQLAKLAVNALINPLTALHRCRNGELLTPSHYPQLVALAAEVDAILSVMDATWTCDALARAEQVAALTAANTSSMLADVLAGRATEIAFINGYLLREAERLGVSAPLNHELLQRLG